MLRVEVEIFSGRPNPSWIVTNESLEQKVLKTVGADRAIAGKPGAGFQGLGFRGMVVQRLGDNDDIAATKIPQTFVLGTGTGEKLKAGGELAIALAKEMLKSAQIVMPEHQLTPIDREMRDLIISALTEAIKNPRKERPAKIARAVMRRRTIGDAKCTQCQYEISLFNPAFWNSNPSVQRNNNCYNYARNWRTDTFAQPGRASGHPNSVMQCAQVSAAGRFDGLVDRCRCLPASEYPRRLMALVIWPNVDYHWYRHQQGGFWGHKPGQTPAKNTDNSGVVIANPETCNRGGYVNFCGYFYAGKSVVIA